MISILGIINCLAGGGWALTILTEDSQTQLALCCFQEFCPPQMESQHILEWRHIQGSFITKMQFICCFIKQMVWLTLPYLPYVPEQPYNLLGESKTPDIHGGWLQNSEPSHFYNIRKQLDSANRFSQAHRCSRGCSTNTVVINSFIKTVSKSPFSSQSSKHHNSQTVRARHMKFSLNRPSGPIQ